MPPRPDVTQLHEAINALTAAFNEFQATQNARHEAYLHTHQLLTDQLTEFHNPFATLPPVNNPLPPPKLKLPFFDGSQPLEWIFQANQFFTHYSIPENQRLSRIACYMRDDALSWFQWMYNSNLLSSWEEFIHDLELRFGPSSYENHQQALFKLQQKSTVHEYQKEFEKICNRVDDLSPSAILNCFISGLRSDIKNEMAILRPETISQAIGLAKLVESKLAATKSLSTHPYRGQQRPFTPSTSQPPLLPSPSTRLALPAPTNTPSNFPIKRLSPSEMQNRRSKGLCFNCDERFTPGHRCKNRQFLLLTPDDDDPPSDTTPQDLTEPELETFLSTEPVTPPIPTQTASSKTPTEASTTPHLEHFHLSLHAINGQPSPKTLRFTATIYGHRITVLVDTGSSHNIMQPRIAIFLKLLTQDIPTFSVMVGNGEQIYCSGFCPNVPLTIQDHTLTIPFYLLPIQGADAVLGVQWLQTLGPFVSDYTVPSMQFHSNNKLITIEGSTSGLLTQASSHQLSRMLHTDSVASLHAISMLPHPKPNYKTVPNPHHRNAHFPR